jgi:hypothetical protein
VARWFPGATIAANALVDLGSVQAQGQAAERQPWELGVDNFLLLESAAAAGLAAGGRLAVTGPLKSAGTDGKDIGVDFEQLGRALASTDVPAVRARLR